MIVGTKVGKKKREKQIIDVIFLLNVVKKKCRAVLAGSQTRKVCAVAVVSNRRHANQFSFIKKISKIRCLCLHKQYFKLIRHCLIQKTI
jgi:hypothetical protein